MTHEAISLSSFSIKHFSICLALILLPLIIIPFFKAHQHLDTAQLLERDSATIPAAIIEYRKAVSWRHPFGLNLFSEQAKERLGKLALASTNDSQAAALALKRGLVSSRSFLDPSPELSAELEKLINRSADDSRGVFKEESPPKIFHGWQFLSQIFFWSWISSVGLFIFKGFDSTGSFLTRSGPGYLIGSLVCYVLWLIALGQGRW